ncbi:MAG: Stp1/IreP family PP2C-type Ser/Thr phosphatase [Candidatus Syntrophonatronum acetioxidans]|uniref:Stp1/IreP family PP2C-type Ser/Thr phosphatase n=1 Tax=Candidatus Syntrophonatronum acetioxidans TaxID=1795816 RepID=A0A424YHU8_9FIRM|nr:MAG: Stp1/IreP family PP2C-type Ser/Thr phosphatase [Candidatus Syntrophonatronum acetioxidans]
MLVKGKTDIGKERQKNEDSYIIIDHDKGIGLFAVADGMGGHLGGDVASSLAVEMIRDFYQRHQAELIESFPTGAKDLLRKMFIQINEKIWHESLIRPDLKGMGTTLTVAFLIGEQLVIGHIGDSRAYKIRTEGVWQLTEDHTYVQKLVKENKILPGEKESHPQRNLLIRALGTNKRVEVDIYFYHLTKGDLILLCTDGLTRTIPDEEMKDLVLSATSPEEAVDELIKVANKRGGPDNITALLVSIN